LGAAGLPGLPIICTQPETGERMDKSYQVSARKWRPKLFEEVIGQGHITQTLQNAVQSGRVAHAYLFSGERGVGKTTVARIFAKALNCEKGPTINPCNDCVTCREIWDGMAIDVIEIDGASNTGVDDIRELREAVKYIPVRGRYKVYIIDEVHMLSTSAFNALLKTLEEPPDRVIFLFATTELHKIPPTILSRCQHFTFKRIPFEEMIRHLQGIAVEEKIEMEEGGYRLIARAAEGSMRDALSILDQSVAFCGQKVDLENLRTLLGIVNQQILERTIHALHHQDTSDVMALVNDLVAHGTDLRKFLGDLVEYIRNLLMIKVSTDPFSLVDLPREEVEHLKQIVASLSLDELQRWTGHFVKTQVEIKLSLSPRFSLELALVKATRMVRTTSLEDLIQRLHAMEKRLTDLNNNLVGEEFKGGDRSSEKVQRVSPKPASSDEAVPPELFLEKWNLILKRIKEEKPNLGSYLEQGRVVDSGPDKVTIGFPENSSFLMKLVQKEEHMKVLERTLEQVMQRPLPIKWTVLDPGSKTEPLPYMEKSERGGGEEMNDPIQTPLIKETLAMFGGKIIEAKEE